MNQKHFVNFTELNHIPKKNLSELEELSNKMMESMRMKLQNPSGTSGDQGSFQKMVDQTRGQDVSVVSELTKAFLDSKKKNLSD